MKFYTIMCIISYGVLYILWILHDDLLTYDWLLELWLKSTKDILNDLIDIIYICAATPQCVETTKAVTTAFRRVVLGSARFSWIVTNKAFGTACYQRYIVELQDCNEKKLPDPGKNNVDCYPIFESELR